MADYEAKTWAKGDVVTSDALNHLEQGVAAKAQQGDPGTPGEPGKKGDPGTPGTPGKDAPTIASGTLTIDTTAKTGTFVLTDSEGNEITVATTVK